MNAPEYERMYSLEESYWWFVARRGLALKLLKRSCSADQPKVLDFGCGTGIVATELSAWSVPIGLDMSDLALEFSHSRNLKNLVQGDGSRLPFRNLTFEAALALDIFEHIEDDRAAFAEVFRSLKPGGVLVLSVPAFQSLWGPHDVALMHFRRYRKRELCTKLKEAGFEIEKASYSVFFLFPLVAMIRFFERRKSSQRASLPAVPQWVNACLIKLQSFETWLICKGSLPWGSSVVVVARKPLQR